MWPAQLGPHRGDAIQFTPATTLAGWDHLAAQASGTRRLSSAASGGPRTVPARSRVQARSWLPYNQQGDFANAVQYLERFFELARSIGDKALLDKARTYLGIARGNSVLPSFMNVVTNDLDALLRWKNRRTPFTEAAH